MEVGGIGVEMGELFSRPFSWVPVFGRKRPGFDPDSSNMGEAQ